MIALLRTLFFSVAYAAGQGIEGVSDNGAVQGMFAQIRATFSPYSSGAGLAQSISSRVLIIVRACVGTAAVIAIVYAGLQVATGASEDRLGEAKKIIAFALGGVIIVLIGPAIFAYVGGLISLVFG